MGNLHYNTDENVSAVTVSVCILPVSEMFSLERAVSSDEKENDHTAETAMQRY